MKRGAGLGASTGAAGAVLAAGTGGLARCSEDARAQPTAVQRSDVAALPATAARAEVQRVVRPFA